MKNIHKFLDLVLVSMLLFMLLAACGPKGGFIALGSEPVDLIIMNSSLGLPSSSESRLDLFPRGTLAGRSETTVYITVSLGNGK